MMSGGKGIFWLAIDVAGRLVQEHLNRQTRFSLAGAVGLWKARLVRPANDLNIVGWSICIMKY